MNRPSPGPVRLARTVALVALATVPAAPAFALDPIDDFEVAPFSFASQFAYQEHVVSLGSGYPGHAFHHSRTIVLEPQGGNSLGVAAETKSGPNPGDRYAEVFVDEGRVRIQYEWDGTRDLTLGGSVDRVEVILLDSPPDAQVTAVITGDGAGVGVNKVTGSGGPQVLTWDLSQWDGSPVDPAQARSFGVHFAAAGSDYTYDVLEIRYRRAGGIRPDLLGDFLATQVPPIPSPPLRFRTFDDVLHPIHTTDLIISNASTETGEILSMDAGMQILSDPGGEYARTSFGWSSPGGGFAELRLQFQVELSPANGWLPMAYPPDPVHSERTVALSFPVMMVQAGLPIGNSDVRLVADLNEIQGAEIQEVQVTPLQGRGAGSGFSVSMLIVPTTGIDEQFPLLAIEWEADWQLTIGPTGVEPRPSPAADVALTARPSVTRGGTTLVATRGLRPGESVTIHDVTGRLLRRLDTAAGTRAVRWDGRDAGGSPLPSGVYFARVGSGPEGVARVVRVR
jgi:hypothetical protein